MQPRTKNYLRQPTLFPGGQKMQNKKNHAAEESPARMRSGTPSQQRLEKLRAEANSCALMSRSEANSAKRELFRRPGGRACNRGA